MTKKKFCSGNCRTISAKRNYHRKPRLGSPKIYKIICSLCSKEFETKRWSQKYCYDPCRPEYIYPSRKEEVILAMRTDFLRLKEINPVKAQKIADEMEIIEGEEFRDLALDGLAPFRNSKSKK